MAYVSLENYPTHFKTVVYRLFVDDTFLFRSNDHVEKSKNHLHNKLRKTVRCRFYFKLTFSDIFIPKLVEIYNDKICLKKQSTYIVVKWPKFHSKCDLYYVSGV